MHSKIHAHTILTIIPQTQKRSLTRSKFLFIEITRLLYSTYQSGNSMQSKNYDHTISTVFPQLKRDP